MLDFEIPFTVAEIDAAKAMIVAKNNFIDAYVRPIAWRGSACQSVVRMNSSVR